MNPNIIPPATVAFGLLAVCVAVFWLWISHSKVKKRLRKLEAKE